MVPVSTKCILNATKKTNFVLPLTSLPFADKRTLSSRSPSLRLIIAHPRARIGMILTTKLTYLGKKKSEISPKPKITNKAISNISTPNRSSS